MKSLQSILFILLTTIVSTFSFDTNATPNFVLVVLDDAVPGDIDFLPATSAYLRTTGVEFEKAFVSNNLCCPSRASILTGNYSHNTGVLSNQSGSQGGYEAFLAGGNESKTIAAWLQKRA